MKEEVSRRWNERRAWRCPPRPYRWWQKQIRFPVGQIVGAVLLVGCISCSQPATFQTHGCILRLPSSEWDWKPTTPQFDACMVRSDGQSLALSSMKVHPYFVLKDYRHEFARVASGKRAFSNRMFADKGIMWLEAVGWVDDSHTDVGVAWLTVANGRLYILQTGGKGQPADIVKSNLYLLGSITFANSPDLDR